jgi:hypothetical protein
MFRHYSVILRKLIINTLTNYTVISNAACASWQGIDYKLPENYTIVSKHVGV